MIAYDARLNFNYRLYLYYIRMLLTIAYEACSMFLFDKFYILWVCTIDRSMNVNE
jgi:hypothetical protein